MLGDERYCTCPQVGQMSLLFHIDIFFFLWQLVCPCPALNSFRSWRTLGHARSDTSPLTVASRPSFPDEGEEDWWVETGPEFTHMQAWCDLIFCCCSAVSFKTHGSTRSTKPANRRTLHWNPFTYVDYFKPSSESASFVPMLLIKCIINMNLCHFTTKLFYCLVCINILLVINIPKISLCTIIVALCYTAKLIHDHMINILNLFSRVVSHAALQHLNWQTMLTSCWP